MTNTYRKKIEPFTNLNSLPLPTSQAGASTDKREHLYKILVIGELGTGKTSIIKRYVHQFFSQHYRATIGVDFALKVLNWDSNTVIRLQLWDIAGEVLGGVVESWNGGVLEWWWGIGKSGECVSGGGG